MQIDDATKIAGALAAGTTSSVTVISAALGLAQNSPGVFTALFADSALAAAHAADRRRAAGETLGPYDGVPFVAKDLFDVAGSVTTAGSPTRMNAAPAAVDCPIIAHLRACGLVLVGKTNLSEFAFSGLGLNPYFGTPVPQYAPERVPGGSSSGTAIAIERGLAPFGLGTDTAGSMRVPAAFNGLVGFRPSQGRYESCGIYPLAATFDVPGPMARTVSDCVALDQMMGGASLPAPSQPRLVVEVGMLDDARLEPEIRDNLNIAVAQLVASGVSLDYRQIETLTRARKLIHTLGWLGAKEAALFHRELLDNPSGRDQVDQRVIKRLDAARLIPEEAAAQLRSARASLMTEVREELGDCVLISPTTLNTAPLLAPLEADAELFASINLLTLSLTMVSSFLDMPSLAVPSGTNAAGLHTSLQFSACQANDEDVLMAGLWWEQIQKGATVSESDQYSPSSTL